MLGKTLGLDISEDTICGVLVKSGLQGRRILGCAAVSIGDSTDYETALAQIVEQLQPGSASCISAVSAEHVSFRNLNLPFTDVRKVRQTISFELESTLPFSIDGLLVDFIVTGQAAEQSMTLAAAVKRSFLAEHLASLAEYGLEPEVLDIRGVPTVTLLQQQRDALENGLFLDIGRKQATVILFLEKRVVLVRRLPFSGRLFLEANETGSESDTASTAHETAEIAVKDLCRTISNTLMAFVDQTDEQRRPAKVFVTGSVMSCPGIKELIERFLELQVEQIDLRNSCNVEADAAIAANWQPGLMDNALALALRSGKPGAGFNFRRDEFEAKKPSRLRQDILHSAVLLAVILAMVLVDFGVEYYFLQKRYHTLDSQVKEIFSRTLPEVTKIVDPVQQLQAKVNEAKKTAGAFAGNAANRKVIDLLDDISGRIPASLDVSVSRVIIDPEGLQIKGTTDTFNTVDSIKQGLSSSDLFGNVTISSANLDRSGNRVLFEIRSQVKY